ncbi:hypothetical protein IAT38_007400 [Cryptococcus sp. DSM 104549]
MAKAYLQSWVYSVSIATSGCLPELKGRDLEAGRENVVYNFFTPEEKLKEIKGVLDTLSKANICLFPNIHTLTLQFWLISSTTHVSARGPEPRRDPTIPFMRLFARSLASVVRPTKCIWNLGYAHDEFGQGVEYEELQFMGGHVPKLMQHRLASMGMTDEMEVPIVCHGTTNVVNILSTALPVNENAYGDVDEGDHEDMVDIAKMCVHCIRVANELPAALPRGEGPKSEEAVEMEKRTGETRWVFQECSSRMYGDPGDWQWGDESEGFLEGAEREVFKLMPEMEGRVTIPPNEFDPYGISNWGALPGSEDDSDEEDSDESMLDESGSEESSLDDEMGSGEEE